MTSRIFLQQKGRQKGFLTEVSCNMKLLASSWQPIYSQALKVHTSPPTPTDSSSSTNSLRSRLANTPLFSWTHQEKGVFVTPPPCQSNTNARPRNFHPHVPAHERQSVSRGELQGVLWALLARTAWGNDGAGELAMQGRLLHPITYCPC